MAEAKGEGSSTKSSTSPYGHCAYCLLRIPLEKVNWCSRCNRRAYCSPKCEITDWTLRGNGQGHQFWCSVQPGEEDEDWEVKEVGGKPIGLFAKRAIPQMFRIMVDANRPEGDERIRDLLPEGGTMEVKYKYNCFVNEDHEGNEVKVLCLRIARANHCCNANAGHVYDSRKNVRDSFQIFKRCGRLK